MENDPPIRLSINLVGEAAEIVAEQSVYFEIEPEELVFRAALLYGGVIPDVEAGNIVSLAKGTLDGQPRLLCDYASRRGRHEYSSLEMWPAWPPDDAGPRLRPVR